jgi:hypothetical protein
MAWRVQRQERSDAFFSAHQIEGFAFGKQRALVLQQHNAVSAKPS